MDMMEKLTILADSAKYDAACTSSGVDRAAQKGGIGNATACGICHSFAADGRCISLLKVLMTNHCIYDCKYCVNKASNDVRRVAFTPRELADLTIQFYRRNYIEGLFLSSGVIKNPDFTMEQMIKALRILRYEYNFWGYIHAKTIPGASDRLVHELGLVADRLSVNIEMPSETSLKLLAPHKTKKAILTPMEQITKGLAENQHDLIQYKSAPKFSPAGQATQMIIGASPETDFQIVRLASGLYKKYRLKRVFYSAYMPTVEDSNLPSLDTKPQLLREHRLYQADWLMRVYKFPVEDIISEDAPNFNPFMDPKCNWAIHNMQFFPVDVNKAGRTQLLRVPGIGPTSTERILTARRYGKLTMASLKKLGVVLKRAQYFIITADQPTGYRMNSDTTLRALIDPKAFTFGAEQLNLFSLFPKLGSKLPSPQSPLHLDPGLEEAVLCIAKSY